MDGSVVSERETIRLAQGGNEDAFALLYQSNMDAVYRYIYKRIGEVHEAENITQSVFTKAWMALDRYKPTVAPFRAWLYRIAHNAVVDHYRAQKETLYWDDLSTVPDRRSSPEEAVLSQERSAQVRQAMTHINPTYQEVLSYRFLNSMDYDETAEALDRKVNNVRVLQHRALSALQKTITQQAITWIALIGIFGAMGAGAVAVRTAGTALPGDSLYVVKTQIEDTVLDLYDEQGDVALYVRFSQRRVDEIEQLLAAGRFADVETSVERLSVHFDHLSATMADIRTKDAALADEFATTFAQSLDTQSTTLATLAAGQSESVQSVLQKAIESAEGLQAEINAVPLREDSAPTDGGSFEFSLPDIGEIDQSYSTEDDPMIEAGPTIDDGPVVPDSLIVAEGPITEELRSLPAAPTPIATANVESAPEAPADEGSNAPNLLATIIPTAVPPTAVPPTTVPTTMPTAVVPAVGIVIPPGSESGSSESGNNESRSSESAVDGGQETTAEQEPELPLPTPQPTVADGDAVQAASVSATDDNPTDDNGVAQPNVEQPVRDADAANSRPTVESQTQSNRTSGEQQNGEAGGQQSQDSGRVNSTASSQVDRDLNNDSGNDDERNDSKHNDDERNDDERNDDERNDDERNDDERNDNKRNDNESTGNGRDDSNNDGGNSDSGNSGSGGSDERRGESSSGSSSRKSSSRSGR